MTEEQLPQGQHVKRAERIEQYQRWSGAQLVNPDGSVKMAADGVDPRVVAEEVRTIRGLLANPTLRTVRLDISDPKLVAAIRAQLQPIELTRVSFGDETPVA